MIPLKPLSQRDTQWSGLKLGDSGLTVGDFGCTFTACVMVAQAFGKNWGLEEALRNANTAGIFNASGSLVWQGVAKVLGVDFGYVWDTNANPEIKHERVQEVDGFRHIEWLASVGIPTVCFVDTNHDGKANHWVAYVGDGKCIDPWDGQTKAFSVFERLYGYAILTGTPVLTGGKISSLIAKANDITHGRNVSLNANEIMQVVTRP